MKPLDEYSPLLQGKVIRVCGVRRSNFLLALYVFAYLSFLVLGTFVFMYLEQPLERTLVRDLRVLRRNFLDSHPCLSDEDLEEFIVEIVRANNHGVSAVRNVTMEPSWSFGQSLFFAGTIVTTIGYGHVTPLSEGGKIFCIVYALVGIPLTLVLLTALVERFMVPVTLFLQLLNSRLGHLYQPFNIRLLHLSFVVLVVIIFFFVIPAAIFANLEPSWDFLDALYYCFISLTTIGLGDYIPGDFPDQPYRALYKLCCTGYLMVGLTFMMLMLTVFYDIPQLNFGLFFLLKSDEQLLDPEKMRLHAGGAASGPKYTPQVDDNVQSIRVKPRSGGDTSSPDDDAHVD